MCLPKATNTTKYKGHITCNSKVRHLGSKGQGQEGEKHVIPERFDFREHSQKS